MNLYEIALPALSNDGADYTSARTEWLLCVMERAGGYTCLGARLGVWRAPGDGKIYDETMHWYQVATSADVMGSLMQDAFRLFPDQHAIFLAKVGTAEIVGRAP